MAERRERPLTAKQENVLHFMWAFYVQNDQLPPVNQLCEEFLFFPQAGSAYIKALERKGYLTPNACPGKYKFTQKAREHFVAASSRFDSLDSHALKHGCASHSTPLN